MLKSEKERLVAELTERLRSTQTLIVADYRGLTMTEIDELRSKLLEHGARFTVVKNTLTRRAAEAAGSEALLALLDGPTAIAFLESDGDPVAVAKALGQAARETQVLEVRGGILDGNGISAADVESLAKLPAAEVLRGQFVGAVAGPLTTVVGLFTAPLRDLVGILEARIRQLEEQGDRSAAEADASPAEEAPAAAVEEASTEEAPVDESSDAELPATESAQEAATEEASAEEAPDASDSAKNAQTPAADETESDEAAVEEHKPNEEEEG